MITFTELNNIPLLRLENESLSATIVPLMGGKISSIYNKEIAREFLWTNKNIPFTTQRPGAEYDPNFIGGIDELIPNDVPEEINGIAYPDHGELWTTPLQHTINDAKITVHGLLPLSGLDYSKTVQLDPIKPILYLEYKIANPTRQTRHFLWKLHAALYIKENDKVISPAAKGLVADPDYCRFKQHAGPFEWPVIEGVDASVIPRRSRDMDFFYLYDVKSGTMQLHSDEALFAFDYDTRIFPYQWWFASYGGFMDHYTGIMEPCTNMPILVSEAVRKRQSAVLEPGQVITTQVRIYAGNKNSYTAL
jgi:hypothetical protein